MCPNCGSCDYSANLIDETPFRSAARFAKTLRENGDLGAAADVLTGLASVRIINFCRQYKWRCTECGVQYDD